MKLSARLWLRDSTQAAKLAQAQTFQTGTSGSSVPYHQAAPAHVLLSLQEFTGDPEDRTAHKRWRKRRADAQARLDKRKRTWERSQKEQVKKRARKEEEQIQVSSLYSGLPTALLKVRYDV